MPAPYTLFEVSWEVANKIGGIYTVLSSKAKTVREHLGDDYVAVGPWLLADDGRSPDFEEDQDQHAFCERCRAAGLPVRVGRWKIPGNPRVLLVEFSSLYDKKDEILGELWEDYSVDSIHGDWDYDEPVLFGWAAGKVIEAWVDEQRLAHGRRVIVHSHEWMTGSALLYLKKSSPSFGTVFTTHATMLGRALSSLGHSPEDGLAGKTPAELASEQNVVAKHSLEGVSGRQADVFTTVSQITADEAELLHGRRPEPILPNGLDLDVVDSIAGDVDRDAARARLLRMTERFLGQGVGDALFVCVSGRYEYHNKGIDVLLDALDKLRDREGRRIVLFVLVPAGNSGVRSELIERLRSETDVTDGPLGISTHNLFDPEHDPVQEHCQRLGFDNTPGSRIQIVQVPIYLAPGDGLLDLPYEAVLRAMDLTCFPSYYEPWGYTPQESLAVGVPTITTDYAGFGRWARSLELGPEQGITVLDRVHVEYAEITASLAQSIDEFVARHQDGEVLRAACRQTAARASWSDLFVHYEQAYSQALEAVEARLKSGVVQTRRPRVPVPLRAPQPGPRLIPFGVAARLPEELKALERLSRNLAWSWDPEAEELFRELAPLPWEASHHNPVFFLRHLGAGELEERAADADYVARVERVSRRIAEYLEAPLDTSEVAADRPVAYFSAEFGLHASMPIYSGGLGVLAGDHLKAASDLGLPLVAVGLFYRRGYVLQHVSSTGDQIAADADNQPAMLPMELVREEDGEPLEVTLGLPGRRLHLRCWRVDVGRVPLYLLDADTPSNREEDRRITERLYGGDQEVRIQQEIALGRGGMRLLRRIGVEPSAYHLNEGHAAFLTLERVTELVRTEGLTFEEAREFIRATTLFTTHTPVPAGHDRFSEELVRRYFSDVAGWAGVPWERFYALGHSSEHTDTFNMTYLALNFASVVNGVSKVHGIASRTLLRSFWPNLLESEVPIQSVTNGVHLPTWTQPGIQRLLAGEARCSGADFAARGGSVDVDELWAVRQEARRRLVDQVRTNVKHAFLERNDDPLLLTKILDGLTDQALLIGFARRFAPYKRAHLLFQDLERLERLLDDPARPMRILIAGKAHPKDELGKSVLRSVIEWSRRDELAGKVVFLEDYEMQLAHYLVQGVDVWLNTPTRMQEASGTSGMKAAANGGLNLSIADGWWPEAADGVNGWTLGGARVYDDQELQDQLDSAHLYQLLEGEVAPLFFERDAQGVPRAWLERVRANLATIPPVFDTDRMVRDYVRLAYARLAANSAELGADRRARLKEVAGEAQAVRKRFQAVRIVAAHVADVSDLKVGDRVDVAVDVDLGELSPDRVAVELVLGHSVGDRDLRDAHVSALTESGAGEAGATRFEGSGTIERAGTHAYGIRVRPLPEADPFGALKDLALWA